LEIHWQKEEQSVVEKKVNQIAAGTPSHPRRKKYRDLDERLLTIVEGYGKSTVSEFLLGLAHKIAFYE